MSGINSAGEMENVYVPYVLSVYLSLNPHFHTFYYFLPHRLWLLTPSKAILFLVFFSFQDLSLCSFCSIFFDTQLFHFPVPSLCLLFFYCSLSLPVLVLFCPSGVWDSRQCWEAYGLLIKKQGGTRPQLTRTHTQTFALLYL